MALLQDILQSLTDMGLSQGTGWGGDYMGISSLDPDDIASKLSTYFDIPEQYLPAHMFQGISSDVLRA